MGYPMTLFKFGEAREIADAGQEAKARAEGFTEPYKYQEYPKSMHKGGDREDVHRVVANKAEEDAARSDGFRMIDEPEAEPEPKAKKAKKED